MKQIFLILCVLYFSGAAYSQNAVVAPIAVKELNSNAPEVIALQETEYNFGKIPQGKPVTHIFLIKNNGNTPLALDNVQASCGCTTPEWSKDPIAPGATAKINVGFNAMSDGPFTKFITITYNGTQNKQVTIKGEVWKTPANSAPENSALNSLKNQL